MFYPVVSCHCVKNSLTVTREENLPLKPHVNTGINLDLTVNTFRLYHLNEPFAVEKSGESLKWL